MITLFEGDDFNVKLKNNNAFWATDVWKVFTVESSVFVIEVVDPALEAIFINNDTYNFYGRDSVEVDMSSFLRANASGTVEFITDDESYYFDFESLNGIKPKNEVMIDENVRADLPFNFLVSTIGDSVYSLSYWDAELSEWVDEVGGEINEIFTATTDKKKWKLEKEGVLIGLFNVNDLECGKQYKFIKWLSSTGLMKEWYFEVEADEVATDRQVSFYNNTDDYRISKNKLLNVSLIHRDCNSNTFEYLSDIVISDIVILVDGENETYCNVVESASKIARNTMQRQDFRVSLNLKRYDTV